MNMQTQTIPLSRVAAYAVYSPHNIINVTPDTIRWMKTSLSSLIRFLDNDFDFKEVTVQDIDAWQRHEMGRGISPVTINSYLRGLKTTYSRLQKNGMIGHNPAQPILYIPEPRPNPKAISCTDYIAMRNAAKSIRDKAIVATLWATGSRIGGLIKMQLNEMDRWQINGEHRFALYVTEKFNKSRWVYAGGEEGDFLHAWLKQRPVTSDPAIFLTQTQPARKFSRSGMEHVLRRLRILAKIPKARPSNAHAFRHAFAIRKLNEGYDLAVVSQWLGHSNPEFTARVYAIRHEAELRQKYFEKPVK